MVPHADRVRGQAHGIARVIEAYFDHLPEFDIELVPPDTETYDLKVTHAGMAGPGCDVAMLHGLYWTADYPAASWEFKANKNVIAAARAAREITVPSEWVAEAVKRDMRVSPHVIPHGIDWESWQHDKQPASYVLWNKNRAGQDVCDPVAVGQLAQAFPNVRFVTTFAAPEHRNLSNIKTTGRLPFDKMRPLVQSAFVYLATTKETFGIGILEAMASGVPVLGYAHGGILDTVEHGVSGYLASPNNLEDLIRGLAYCIEHRAILGANARELS
jgi:glycosyltransferase involved in cell wall biosynthesis